MRSKTLYDNDVQRRLKIASWKAGVSLEGRGGGGAGCHPACSDAKYKSSTAASGTQQREQHKMNVMHSCVGVPRPVKQDEVLPPPQEEFVATTATMIQEGWPRSVAEVMFSSSSN